MRREMEIIFEYDELKKIPFFLVSTKIGKCTNVLIQILI
jgi:hypothetical protein